MIAFTQINSNTTAFETPQYDGNETITMRFEEGQSVVLTFPSVVNIGSQSISLSRVDMDGGTTILQEQTFTMDNDKEITMVDTSKIYWGLRETEFKDGEGKNSGGSGGRRKKPKEPKNYGTFDFLRCKVS